jgi:hypothetical protein
MLRASDWTHEISLTRRGSECTTPSTTPGARRGDFGLRAR